MRFSLGNKSEIYMALLSGLLVEFESIVIDILFLILLSNKCICVYFVTIIITHIYVYMYMHCASQYVTCPCFYIDDHRLINSATEL